MFSNLQEIAAVGPEQSLLVGDYGRASWSIEPGDKRSSFVLQLKNFVHCLSFNDSHTKLQNLFKYECKPKLNIIQQL
jgi:hypothetical protein